MVRERQRRLRGYAKAAALAVPALAAGAQARAEIATFTVTLSGNQALDVDFDRDGTDDFQLSCGYVSAYGSLSGAQVARLHSNVRIQGDGYTTQPLSYLSGSQVMQDLVLNKPFTLPSYARFVTSSGKLGWLKFDLPATPAPPCEFTAAVALDGESLLVGHVPPRADAGEDREVEVGAMVQLDGAASSDPFGDALLYSWQLTQRPTGSAATLAGANTPTPTFLADEPGVYVIELTVDDQSGVATATDSAAVTITATTPAPQQQLTGGPLVPAPGLELDAFLGAYEDARGRTFTLTSAGHLLQVRMFVPAAGEERTRGAAWSSVTPDALAASWVRRPTGETIVLQKQEGTDALLLRVFAQGIAGARPTTVVRETVLTPVGHD